LENHQSYGAVLWIESWVKKLNHNLSFKNQTSIICRSKTAILIDCHSKTEENQHMICHFSFKKIEENNFSTNYNPNSREEHYQAIVSNSTNASGKDNRF
jgi:hypothetical protein